VIHPWLRRGLFAAAGAALGYAYYHWIGCVSGTCPISSNAYLSTLYGTLLGGLLGLSAKTRSKDEGPPPSNPEKLS
jgi:phage shock protein E